ncbi:MAG: hypothetical protein KJO63_09670, partial [Maribacter sp.]|nr:hypothetical protein [Maribacter sp.]
MVQYPKIIAVLVNFTWFLNIKSKLALLFIWCICLSSSAQRQETSFFETDEIAVFNLRADLKTVFKDRGDDPQYHKATIQYKADSNSINIPIKIKTRGHFRKLSSNCKYPPLFLNFKKSTIPKNSVFNNLEKVKLVTPCQADKYVVYEFLVYKMYNLITPRSFKPSLVKVIYQDTVKNKSSKPYYGILLEEEEQMAKRNHSSPLEKMGLSPEGTKKEEFMKMAVFQYMIGNTDWSVQFQQNIKLIMADSLNLPIAIPYDFDHAGIVRAPYAKPAPELQLGSTLQRRYRGYCIPEMKQYSAIFKSFNQLKDDFYALYDGNPLLS